MHLAGRTITLNSNAWYPVSINDDDASFGDSDTSQTLNGPQTIDGVTYPNGRIVEAEYGLTLSDGVNTWQVVGFNVNNSSPAYGTVEGLAFIGGSGGFPPVRVPLTIVSTQEGPNYLATNYATPICFANGTLLETGRGTVAVESIGVGDLVATRDDGLQPVRWRADRTLPAYGTFAPILFRAGAIGNTRPLRLSPQHKVLVTGWRAELICGENAVLVPALHFVDGVQVIVETGGVVTYHHLMFDRHQIVFSEGIATESFFPGAVGLAGLDLAARREMLAIFPQLATDIAAYGPPVLPVLSATEARVLMAA